MFSRILGVFKLDARTFEEIEHDPGATSQAAIIVILVALISGVGAGLGASLQQGRFFGGFIGAVLSALLGWLLWSLISWFIGTSLFGGQATVGEMLRVIGFAYSPQVLGIIPCIGGIVGAIWSLVAGFIAIRQGLDLDNLKALLTIVLGFIAYIVLYIILGIVLGGVGALLGQG